MRKKKSERIDLAEPIPDPDASKKASGVQPVLSEDAPSQEARSQQAGHDSQVMRAERVSKRRRRHSRIDTQLPVEVLVEGSEEPQRGRCANLSLGGMFLLLDPVPPHGAQLRVWLALPTGDRLMVTGTVRWSTPDGVGIQHELLGARDTYVLSGYLASLKAGED